MIFGACLTLPANVSAKECFLTPLLSHHIEVMKQTIQSGPLGTQNSIIGGLQVTSESTKTEIEWSSIGGYKRGFFPFVKTKIHDEIYNSEEEYRARTDWLIINFEDCVDEFNKKFDVKEVYNVPGASELEILNIHLQEKFCGNDTTVTIHFDFNGKSRMVAVSLNSPGVKYKNARETPKSVYGDDRVRTGALTSCRQGQSEIPMLLR